MPINFCSLWWNSFLVVELINQISAIRFLGDQVITGIVSIAIRLLVVVSDGFLGVVVGRFAEDMSSLCAAEAFTVLRL